ncbi:MFS transporter [Azospirillum doebereinerae]
MTGSANRPATRLATRLSFLVAGFGMACWAPLVPFAKERLGAGDAQLGVLLLCLGVGSLAAMPVTGALTGRLGSRPMILLGGVGLCAALPLLALASSAPGLAAALLLFGASLGMIDVAMNIHAVEVERDSSEPLMSGFHGLFSVGGFAGAGGMTLLLWAGLAPFPATVVAALLGLALLAVAGPRLLAAKPDSAGGGFARPRGIVLLLASLAALVFLAEGAILDWSALLLTEQGLVGAGGGGVGYMVFSVAMTVGRLFGDRVVSRLGGTRVLAGGGAVTIAGFAVLLLSPSTVPAIGGFLLIGLGASNIVPVLFSATGRQTAMPASLAVAAMTTVGYAGILVGPALMGFVAQGVGLYGAFWLLAALIGVVPLAARHVRTA